jgi:hypothetical protein
MKDDNNKTGALYCSCGCDDGVLLKFEDDWGLELSLVSDTFYLQQQKNTMSFKEKCKRIWKIIRNEEYEYFGIFINKDDMKEFKDFVAQM